MPPAAGVQGGGGAPLRARHSCSGIRLMIYRAQRAAQAVHQALPCPSQVCASFSRPPCSLPRPPSPLQRQAGLVSAAGGQLAAQLLRAAAPPPPPVVLALDSLPASLPVLPAEAEALLLEWGKNELEERRKSKLIVYLEHRECRSAASLTKRRLCQ